MPLTGNKGEWSEIYTLFKLLGDGVVYAGNGDMEKIPDLFYPILKVIRQEEYTYEYAPKEKEQRMVIIYREGEEIMRVSMERFASMAERLLNEIREAKGPAFSIESIEDFMGIVKCRSLKAKSVDKSDIRIMIHDLRTGTTPTQGFSIKSQLGHPSTLLNPGMTTNFSYDVTGGNVPLTDDYIASVNAIPGQIDRMKKLFDDGFSLKYCSMDCETFEDNLLITDSWMPEIIAESIAEHFISGKSEVKDLMDKMIVRNPLGVRKPADFYEAKMKSLLVDVALGMTPATPWKRVYDANGGYIVVRKDGEVLCYHFYDRNELEDYLYKNTRYDFPSRDRYHYGSLYKEKEFVRIKLNFQIRFK